jgi:sugar phosphate isomerase/epimerase
MVFIPKAQTSQWEIQLMALKPIGNILEADTSTRQSLDRAMLATMKILAALGANLVTIIEYSKRFDATDTDQRLIYAFLPRLPQSPGAYTEAQLRWIINHYPEDFAAACRSRLPEVQDSFEI